jgi:hypothetical protein
LVLVVLIVVARPLTVLVSTPFSSLTRAERMFLAGLAPRGIVAASVASVFALRLDRERFPQAEMLVPLTFAAIIGTVSFYGLSAVRWARKLGLTGRGRQGFLIAGAGRVERALGEALHGEGFPVLLVDTNRENIAAARLSGLPVLHASVLSHVVIEETQLAPIGRFLALTSNDEVNALAAVQFQRTFTRSEVYQLAPVPRSSERQEKVSRELRGRVLFAPDVTYDVLESRILAGHTIKKTGLTAGFTFGDFKKISEMEAIPLFVRTQQGELVFFTTEVPPKPKPGEQLFSLAPPRPPRAAEPANAGNGGGGTTSKGENGVRANGPQADEGKGPSGPAAGT